MALSVTRLPTWASGKGDPDAGRRKTAEIDARACDECGRTWSEVPDRLERHLPDDRGYVQLTGRIGVSVIRTTLCPACADDLITEVEIHLDDLERIVDARTELWERREDLHERMLERRDQLERRHGLTPIKGGGRPGEPVAPPDLRPVRSGKRGVRPTTPAPSEPCPPRPAPPAR